MEELVNEVDRLTKELTEALRELRAEIKSDIGEDNMEYQSARFMHNIVDNMQDALIGLRDALKEKELV